MTTLLLLAAILVGGMLLTVLFLWGGARLAGAPRARFHHALLTLLIVVGGWLAAIGVPNSLLATSPIAPPDVAVAGLLFAGMLGLLWLWLVTRLVMRATTAQVIYAWLPTLLPCLVVWGLLNFLVRPCVLETDHLRSNSMSPTLLAMHHRGTCPHCQGTAFVPYTATAIEGESPADRVGMCGDCRRLARVHDTNRELLRADRFVINKLLAPRRWDLVAFRDPGRTSGRVRFVKRLVGLPGEEITIRDGAAWANGQRLEPPPELTGLEYSNQQFDGAPIHWGTEAKPARLGPDEYFVLDDFTMRGNDSRMWVFAAEGRAPYALPGSSIEGVVAYTWWPYERFRVFR